MPQKETTMAAVRQELDNLRDEYAKLMAEHIKLTVKVEVLKMWLKGS
jgi:hypothetical protein